MQNNRQQGSILLVSLIFLVLTSMITVTILNTSILEMKMAGNEELRQDARAKSEAIVNHIMDNYTAYLWVGGSPDDMICEVGSTVAGCDQLRLLVPAALAPDSKFDYFVTALNGDVGTPAATTVENAGSYNYYYFDINVEFDGVSEGLSNSHLRVGTYRATSGGGGGGNETLELN